MLKYISFPIIYEWFSMKKKNDLFAQKIVFAFLCICGTSVKFNVTHFGI